ncbi:MAG: hypothetical protein KDA24_04065 [Deltaproteobacteria bacterium]|nr:hypothetical protein [Deltaproteobacteria bacterium]
MSRHLLRLLLLLLLAAAFGAAPALAQDDLDDLGDLDDLEDEDDEDAEELDDEEVDNEEIYNDYKSELRGESAAEELDAWRRYLEVYPKSEYRMEIEKRMSGLEEAAFRELSEDDLDEEVDDAEDAKDQEMFLAVPALIQNGINPRRRFKLQALWGFDDMLNYELGFEWAFMRQFSAYGTIRHQGRGFGAQIAAGAKYALVKDVRTGLIVTGAFGISVGFNAFDKVNFGIEPMIGFGWIASEKFQVQTSITPYLRLDRLRFTLVWDAMIVVSPTPVLSIYVESRQKHSPVSTENSGTKYFGFHHAGVGVKIYPQKTFELTVGVNVPYAWDRWKDYKYFGVHAGLAIFFDKKKKG